MMETSCWLGSSVTRIGDFLATFETFFKSLGNFNEYYFVFGKILNLVWQYFMLLGKFTLLEKAKC